MSADFIVCRCLSRSQGPESFMISCKTLYGKTKIQIMKNIFLLIQDSWNCFKSHNSRVVWNVFIVIASDLTGTSKFKFCVQIVNACFSNIASAEMILENPTFWYNHRCQICILRKSETWICNFEYCNSQCPPQQEVSSYLGKDKG